MAWFDPWNDYGGPFGPSGFEPTPWGESYLDLNQDAAFTRWGAKAGVGQTDSAFDRYFRQQFARANEGFKAALATNPNLRFGDYLNSINMNAIRAQFNQLAPDQRGENRSAYAPTARVVNW